MKPVVVLVGRPNVGKSTLFNALTRSRDALVADVPGLTRDRLYGNGLVGDRPYLVVDTGGISDDRSALGELMSVQVRQAITEADVVVLLVDGRAGPNAADRSIADEIRRLGKSAVLAVNKTEGMDPGLAVAEFHALAGGQPVAISASHGDGIDELMRRVLVPLPRVEEEHASGDVPRIAVVGRPNVGKSTLVNAMLGEERVVVYDEPGTTRDSIYIPLERAERRYVLIDTAGVRRRGRIDDAIEKYSVIKTLQAIEVANVVLLVLDARQEVSEQDVSLAGHVLEEGRSLVLAVNKWDGLDESRRDWIKRELERRLAFVAFCPPHFISALRGSGVGALFPAIDRAYASARRTIPTSRLNRILLKAVQVTAPPMVHGRRIKLKYVHQGGKNPPLLVIHGNQTEAMPGYYTRYLSNAFRQALGLEGTPVRIEFVQSENPYEGKRNRLTPRQFEKRQRLRRIARKKYG
ncbi:MAG: ribosome biogenesis GTPase Der [Gammaproteobacteria bacterium]|nr:ribosome biogenesis GTPase Der [Gammaproteobacteria bacterium]